MKEPGLYEISGLAWSGYGKIAKVEISADGGKSWAHGRSARAGAVEGVDAFPHGVALERRPRRPAKPRDRRHRLRPADARENDRQSWKQDNLSLQCGHDLGRVRKGEVKHVYA